MPDVILFDENQSWLFLIESVTSHGPVDGKRYLELKELFSDAQAALVYVTALPSRTLMARFLSDIAWETEVWVSEAPSHLIHFNGDKFLGPYSM
jgi:type II restriction enzyme